jgi:hypothetical protein
LGRVTFGIPITARLVSIREPVQKQKIENLILAGGWRRSELPPRQGSEIYVHEAFFDLDGHVKISFAPDALVYATTSGLAVHRYGLDHSRGSLA